MRAAAQLLVVALSFLTSVASAQTAPPLLRETFAGDAASGRAERAIRSRFVRPDLAPLALPDLRPGQRIAAERRFMANLFDDTWLPVRIRSIERDLAGSYVAIGSIEGDPQSDVTIAVNGGAMSAVFSTARHVYTIQPAAMGRHLAIEPDVAKYPNELMPISLSLPRTPHIASTSTAVATAVNPTWDVGVVYTTVAKNYYGSTATINALISDAVAAANTAYTNSGVNATMRLVGTLEVDYDDTTHTFSQALQSLQNPADGVMDNVAAWRTQVGADAVTLIVKAPTDSACGLGYMMWAGAGNDFAPYAFNVVLGDCAVGNFSMAHELGHNFGLNHDRANASGTPSFDYAYGYRDPGATFRTIMSYAGGACGNCPRVQYFSNTTKTYNGLPMGISYEADAVNSADNVRALNNNASIIAGWTATAILTPPAVTFTDDPLVAGTTTIKAVHVTELRTAIDSFRQAAGLGAATWSQAISQGVVISASHITELRTNLLPALTYFGRTPTYTNATISAGATVKAVDIQEIRNIMK